MKFFFRMAENIDVIPLMLALKQNDHLWNVNKLRTTHTCTPHSEVDDIWIRFIDLKPYVGKTEEECRQLVLDQHESIPYEWGTFPEIQKLCNDLMYRVGGIRLGRVLITKVQPGKRIYPHVDSGDHARYYERFHIVLQSSPGSIFIAGDEQVNMKTGELWWFQNQIEHEVINNGSVDRIHLIVDIHTGRNPL